MMEKAQTTSRSRAFMPDGTAAILDRRDLASGNPFLATLLRPGMAVLDIGCGTGAITRGIAEFVGPGGEVVGLDTNEQFIRRARASHKCPGLSFEVGDAYNLPFEKRFDIVTAGRLLQWLARPLDALHSMAKAVKPGSLVVILDYNHERIVWEPQPPGQALGFYDAFLRWRAEAGFDNVIADHLVELFESAGLVDVATRQAHEVSTSGEPGLTLWADVAATRGHQMVADGVLSDAARAAAEAAFRAWAEESAKHQTLYLISCCGRRSDSD